tara:strand:+ start:505 stop:666 length:162 start_codon:yes stop_codon:yes gene_type:complete
VCLQVSDFSVLEVWRANVRRVTKQCHKALDYYENAIDKADGEDEEKKKKKKGD